MAEMNQGSPGAPEKMDILVPALETACRAADRARQLILANHNKDLRPARKSDGSPVTNLDKDIERAIRAEISVAFPDHAIVGEEFPARAKDSAFKWIIDPIDGTVSLLNRIPTFASLIALCEHGRPVASVVDLPALGERYTAMKGRGAWCGPVRLAVSDSFTWEDSIVCHGDRYTFAMSGFEDLYDALARRARFFRSYTDAFGHTLVARGSAALMIDSAMEPWDLAAPMLLVQEAGGEVALYCDLNQPRRRLAVCGHPHSTEAVAEIAAGLGFRRLSTEEVSLT